MKAKYFFLALSAIALGTSCSNDEVTEISDSNAIKFKVVANKANRAVATTTNTIKEFKVQAYTAGKLLMKDVLVTGSNTVGWTYSNTVFWPNTSVDFFSVSPNSTSVTLNDQTQTVSIKDYSVADGKTDLLYAFNNDEVKKNDAVNVNFRHALSQIAFKVKNTNTSSIDVKIKSIKVEGIADKSTLTWATEATAPNITGVLGDTDTETGTTWGTWDTPVKSTPDSYGITYTFLTDVANPGSVPATSADIGEALFLMPQSLTEWNKKGTSETNYGARLLIDCQIMAGVNRDIQIWPVETTVEYAQVAIPLTNPDSDPNRGTTAESQAKHDKWMQGKKYVYTIIFGEGGGYTPGGGDPVLVPITFTVTVDEFQKGGDYDINME